MYKNFLFLMLIGAGYNSANGMQQLKTMTAIVMARVRATPRAVHEKVLVPVGHEVQRATSATKGATCTLGRVVGEQFGCVRRTKIPHKSKKDD